MPIPPQQPGSYKYERAGWCSMLVSLGIMAGLIILFYSVYFFGIIRGNPEHLEIQMLRSLADWIIIAKASAKFYLWSMYILSGLVEGLYLGLTIVYIQNPVMRILTGLFVGFEIIHLMNVGYNLKCFFRGQYRLSQIFHWGRERASAVLFFTHAVLVLAILTAFSV